MPSFNSFKKKDKEKGQMQINKNKRYARQIIARHLDNSLRTSTLCRMMFIYYYCCIGFPGDVFRIPSALFIILPNSSQSIETTVNTTGSWRLCILLPLFCNLSIFLLFYWSTGVKKCSVFLCIDWYNFYFLFFSCGACCYWFIYIDLDLLWILKILLCMSFPLLFFCFLYSISVVYNHCGCDVPWGTFWEGLFSLVHFTHLVCRFMQSSGLGKNQ